MTVEQIILTIASSLFSGIIAVTVSAIYFRHHENRRIRYDTFKKFMANRFDLKGDVFSQALNEIFVTFKRSRQVMKALSQHHNAVTSGRKSENELVMLFKAMCADLRIDTADFNDSFFLTPYNTRPSSVRSE